MTKEIALKELEILQGVISKQEDIRLKIRGWYIAIVSALLLAFVSKELNINKFEFITTAILISILFLWLEVIHRVAESRAMVRAKEVETMLRDEIELDNPKIGLTLGKSNNFKEQLTALNNVRIYTTYIIFLFLTIALYIFSSNGISQKKFFKFTNEITQNINSGQTDNIMKYFATHSILFEPPNKKYFETNYEIKKYFKSQNFNLTIKQYWYNERDQIGMLELLKHGISEKSICFVVIKFEDEKIIEWREFTKDLDSEYNEYLKVRNKNWQLTIDSLSVK